MITRDIHDRAYGALWKLMGYEDTGWSPDDAEESRYPLEDAAERLKELEGGTIPVGGTRELLEGSRWTVDWKEDSDDELRTYEGEGAGYGIGTG